MRAAQDGPGPEERGPRGGFAGVMLRQPPEAGDREGLDHPVGPEESPDPRVADTPSPGATVAEDTPPGGDAGATGLSDGAVRSSAADARPFKSRPDVKGHDLSAAEVKEPEAGEHPPRALTGNLSRVPPGASDNPPGPGQAATPNPVAGNGATGDVSGGPPETRENPPGPGLAAAPGTVDGASRSGHVDGAPMAGRVPLQEGPASARSGRQPGAAHPPLSAADSVQPRADPSVNHATETGPLTGASAGRDRAERPGIPVEAGQAPPPRPDPRRAAQRDRPAGTETAQAAGPALAAGQRVAVASSAAHLPAPFRAMLMSTDQMARLPIEDAALPLGDLAPGSTGERPSVGASSAGPATPPATRSVPVQIAQQIAVSVSVSESGHTELRLNPEELGRVRLSLSGAEGGLTVSITAERPETADLLRRHTDSLAREFAALGYGDVGFHFEGESREDRAHDQPGGQAASAPEPTLTDPTDPQPPRRGIVLGGGLDLKL
jgi:hypothetical protein